MRSEKKKTVFTTQLIVVMLLFSNCLSGQTRFNTQNNAKKDENTWNLFSRLQGQYQLNMANQLQFSNLFSSRFLLARDTWERDNHFTFLYKHTVSSAFSLESGILSRVITNEEASQEFSQHTLNFQSNWRPVSGIEVRPKAGTGLSTQKAHNNYGVVFGLDSNGDIYSDERDKSGYSLNSTFEDFGARQNRKVDLNVYWGQQFSPYSSDSLSAGYFINYNENYLSKELQEVESIGKENRFIRNDLAYDLSASWKSHLQSTYEWKNLNRNSSFQNDDRTEFALENRIILSYIQRKNSVYGNIRFRNEQRQGSNTAINMETRLTSFRLNGSHALWQGHSIRYNMYLSKYETDTPVSQQQDRDELRWALWGNYNWQITNALSVILQSEVRQSHQTYLFARFSGNNYRNQLFRIKSGVAYKITEAMKNSLHFGIDTNYNLFDFEELDDILRSNLVKTWTLTDTLDYKITSTMALSFVLMSDNVFIGNFDPDKVLFYRSQDRITRQYQIRFRYASPSSFTCVLGGVYYQFDQVDPRKNDYLQSRQINFIPQIELGYHPSTNLRLRLLSEFYNGEITFYSDDKTVTERVFTRLNFNFDYFF